MGIKIKEVNLNTKSTILIIFDCLLVITFLIQAIGFDKTQKLFSIFSSLSLAIALSAYFYKKRQDETLATIEQITFFRKEVIYKWDEISKLIKNKNQTYWFSHIKFEDNKYLIEDIKQKFSDNFNNQLSLFFDSDSLRVEPILDEQVFFLNMLEEFALKVKHFKTQNHPALSSVHKVFVDMIEQNAVAIVFMRDIITNSPVYSEALELYSNWVNKVNKSNYVNNLEKHGFITKDKKKEILKKQRGGRIESLKVIS